MKKKERLLEEKEDVRLPSLSAFRQDCVGET